MRKDHISQYQIFVGIDIGYKTHVACACPGHLFNANRYPDGWKRAKTIPFKSDAKGFKQPQRYLNNFSTNPKHFLILSEPTGGYYGFALQMYLIMKGYKLLQVENIAVNTPFIESLPVKSPIWAATFISMIGNIDRFRSYAGWFPKVAQSGTSIHSSRLANDGAQNLRGAFGQMAQMLLSPNVKTTPFRIYHQRLVAEGMKPSTAVGHMAGKLATVLYQCLKTQTPYDEAKHRNQMGLQDDIQKGSPVEVSNEMIDKEGIKMILHRPNTD